MLDGSDTTLVVTADHGFVDSPPGERIDLGPLPELASSLILPLCGEPRAAYCYLEPRQLPRFERLAADALGERARPPPSEQLLAEGYFGLGDPHPRLAERIGHYTLLMRGAHTLRDRLPGEKSHPMTGFHGGLSPEEMYVPLCLVEA